MKGFDSMSRNNVRLYFILRFLEVLVEFLSMAFMKILSFFSLVDKTAIFLQLFGFRGLDFTWYNVSSFSQNSDQFHYIR